MFSYRSPQWIALVAFALLIAGFLIVRHHARDPESAASDDAGRGGLIRIFPGHGKTRPTELPPRTFEVWTDYQAGSWDVRPS